MQDALFRSEDIPDLANARFALVAVERGIDHSPSAAQGFSYRLPEGADAAPGDRVTVPLGRGNTPTNGVVLKTGGPELLGDFPASKAKQIIKVERLGIPEPVVELARWIARYYVCPLGMALAGVVPAAVKKGTGARVRTALVRGPVPDEMPKLTPTAKRAWEAVNALPASAFPIEPRALADRIGEKTIASTNRLRLAGLLTETQIETVSTRTSMFDVGTANTSGTPPAPPPTPTDEQAGVIGAVSSTLGSFAPHVLFGITGSGKTEVYLRLLRTVLDEGGSAIVLVPEIALTPQTGRRFSERFAGEGVAVLHSGLSASARHKAWADARSGKARIVVGARSAVFAPVTRLGIIIVDEEHDGSYKQDQLPRYHARDVAIKRAQLESCPVVLGSATPSLESWHNATKADAKYQLHTMTTRPTGATLPEVQIVDIAAERKLAAQRGRPFEPGAVGLGPTLLDALDETLNDGGQAVLLLNRRGFAACVACRSCGWTLGCERCDAKMVVHTRSTKPGQAPPRGHLRCHHCHAEQLAPRSCPDCGSSLILIGEGTQRLEDDLIRHLDKAHPGLGEHAIARADSDALSHASHYFALLDRFAKGETKVLLGTQMIAKGLDFPNVRLVGVINADTALSLPDFRASERTFQLVTQVAGRAGRGGFAGRVIVQTFSPEDPSIVHAQRHDFRSFASEEIESRRAAGLPPVSRMARIVCRHVDPGEAAHRATEIARRLRADQGVRVMGPMPCPLAKVNDHFRFAVEIVAPSAGVLNRTLETLRNAGVLVSDSATAIDPDPIALL
ncbi:MAG: primosomal protein N' [Planctomycetota bacterium]